MAGSLKLEVHGLQKFLSELKSYEGEKKKQVSNELKATQLDIISDAQAAAPVDFGNLRRTIRAGTVKEDSIEIEVGANYAAYVEFGTGTLVDISSDPGLREYEATFIGKSKVLPVG